jgi:hypothetical protein
MRNRFSFKDGRAINDVFKPEISTKLKVAVGGIGAAERMVALPDFAVSMPGLVLSGLRILISRGENGSEAIMLRFRRYIGAIRSAFCFDSSMSVEAPTAREKIAVEVLRDLVTPVFDILTLRDHGSDRAVNENSTAINRSLTRVATRKDELDFYTGLLQRYVAGCRSDAEAKAIEGGGGPVVPALPS